VKNETTVLILALLITAAVVGGGAWWFINNQSGFKSNQNNQQATSTSSGDSFAEVENVPSGLFSYGGSTTWAPIRKDVDPSIQTVWPKFQLRYTDPPSGAPGSGSGIKMLLNNQLAFSQSSRSLKDEEYQQAQRRGFTLKEIPVAIDAIAIATHPALKVSGITIAQLKDIYTGKLTNWSKIGGPNSPIIPFSRRLEEGGTIEFFVENVLDGEKFGANVKFISRTTEALRQVAATPGGIYYASAPEVVGQCTVKPIPLGKTSNKLIPPYQEPFVPLSQCPAQRNQVNKAAVQSGEYPITRRLLVIVKQNNQIDEQAGEAYAKLLLTNQGQSAIDKAGFVSIR